MKWITPDPLLIIPTTWPEESSYLTSTSNKAPTILSPLASCSHLSATKKLPLLSYFFSSTRSNVIVTSEIDEWLSSNWRTVQTQATRAREVLGSKPYAFPAVRGQRSDATCVRVEATWLSVRGVVVWCCHCQGAVTALCRSLIVRCLLVSDFNGLLLFCSFHPYFGIWSARARVHEHLSREFYGLTSCKIQAFLRKSVVKNQSRKMAWEGGMVSFGNVVELSFSNSRLSHNKTDGKTSLLQQKLKNINGDQYVPS